MPVAVFVNYLMKTSIAVRLVGPALLCQAMEALLSTISPIHWEESTNGEEEATSSPRRRPTINPTEPLVVLLVGEGWQNRVTAESRIPRRSGDNGVTPRYALIADGNKVDFYGARKMAINAFVGTDEPVGVLVQAIQAAAQNRLYCSPQLLPALIDAVGGGETSAGRNGAGRNGAGSDDENSNASQAALLSAREHEVALHAARGLSNEQIAVFLGISIPTVKFHLMHSFRKLGIQRRTQLYAYMPFLTSATEALLPPVVE